jgi:hypothetical protein
LYGYFLINLDKINDYLPTVRNILVVSDAFIIDITIRYYIISMLMLLSKIFIWPSKLISYIDIPMQKSQISYYIENQLYSVIFAQQCSIVELITMINIFLCDNKLYIANNDTSDNSYCSKITKFDIIYGGAAVNELGFINQTIKKFRGVDGEYNKFHTKYKMSIDMADILQFSYKNYNFEQILINKIPNIVVHTKNPRLDEIE